MPITLQRSLFGRGRGQKCSPGLLAAVDSWFGFHRMFGQEMRSPREPIREESHPKMPLKGRQQFFTSFNIDRIILINVIKSILRLVDSYLQFNCIAKKEPLMVG